jgi:hypothetical protein
MVKWIACVRRQVGPTEPADVALDAALLMRALDPGQVLTVALFDDVGVMCGDDVGGFGNAPPAGCSSSNASSDASTPPDSNAPHHESSSARCPDGTSSALTTPTGPNPSTHPNSRFTSLTERYWV